MTNSESTEDEVVMDGLEINEHPMPGRNTNQVPPKHDSSALQLC